MAVNSALMAVGLSKQSAKGSTASGATFSHGITEGQPIVIDPSQSEDTLSTGSRFTAAAVRDSVDVGQAYTTRVMPKSVGLYLLAALGTCGTTGSGTYTHTISSSGATALPYLTGFGKVGTQWFQVADAKMDELEIKWEKAGALDLAAKLVGCSPAKISAPTITNDETSATPYYAAGGTFKFDADSTTTASGAITGGSVKISNNLTPVVLSTSMAPSDVDDGMLKVDGSLTVRVADLDAELWTLITGTASGTSVSGAPVYGAFEITFVNGSDSLKLAATKVAFLAGFPSYNASGGGVELTLAFTAHGTVTPLTATLINTQATY